MGTNFYLITRNKQFVEKYFPIEYEVTNKPFFRYEIHLNKRSCGWKILYQAHSKAWNSVEEMLDFIRKHNNKVKIFDEYEKEYTLEEYIKEVVEWDKDYKKEEIYYDDTVGYIMTPIDHVEISKRSRDMYINYWHDKDGYDFTNAEFC